MCRRTLLFCLPLFWAAVCVRGAEPQTPGYHELTWTGTVDGQPFRMNYILFLPKTYTHDSPTGYPLILFMGGSGCAGDDVAAAWPGSPAEKLKADPRLEKTFPGILLIAQSPPRGFHWNQPHLARAALQLLEQETRELRVDKSRVSVMGFSEGSWGCWSLGCEDPQRWAVIMPSACKAYGADFAPKLHDVPMWMIDGADDNYSVDAGRKLTQEIRGLGGHVIFTLLPHISHFCAHYYYTNAQYYEWIFDHHRPAAGDRLAGSAVPKAPGRYLEEFDTTVDGQDMHISYTVMLPKGYAPLGPPHPLLLNLSELGAIGQYLNGWCLHGPDLQVERQANEQLRSTFPFIIISPMCPVRLKYWSDSTVEQAIRFGGNTSYVAPESPWNDPTLARALSALMDDVCHKYSVDKSRLYATGLNQGALGVSMLVTTDPSRYAAVAAVTSDAKFTPPPITAGTTAMRTVTTTPNDPISCYAQPEFYAWLLGHRRH